MSKRFRVLLLCLIAMIALAAAVDPYILRAQQRGSESQLPQRVDPQSRQLLDRTIQTLGGPAFLSARSLSTRGRMFFFVEGTTAGMEPFVAHMLYPSKYRVTISKAKKNLSMDTGNITYDGETKPIILVNDGDQGWEIDQYGVISQTDKQLQHWVISNRFSLANLLRLEINQPSVLIQKGQVDFVDNVPTQGIDIVEAGGTNVRLDLDRRTDLPMRITYRVRNIKENDWDEYSDAYSDYKQIDGIMTPMHVTHYLNGDRIGEIFRNEAKYNDTYPDNYFTASAP